MHRRLHAVLQRGHVGEQVEVLKHHADVVAHLAQMGVVGPHKRAVLCHMRQRLPVDIDNALVDLFQRHQHAQHRGFSRSRRPDDRHDFILRHIQIERIQHRQVSIPLGDASKPDNRRIGPKL